MIDKKNRFIALIITLLFGYLGLHKFYLNRNVSGILYFLFCWTFIPAILSIFDFIVLATMSDLRFNEEYNKDTVCM